MDTVFRWLPLMAVFAACDEPGGRSLGLSEVAGDVAELVVPETVTGEADAPAETQSETVAADTTIDVVAEMVTPAAGTAEAPIVRCLADHECGSGEVCCTSPLGYLSDCVAAAECNAGLHDACLVDEQCAARRPGQWSACCHDRANRNYCAPAPETCQPLVACESAADCRENGSDTCCSEHPYYGGRWCTNTFFANNLERDCQ